MKKTDAAVVIYLLSDRREYDTLDQVEIVASGYEFECPKCSTYNTLVEIPIDGRAVECRKCKTRFSVSEADHAIG